MVNKIKNSLSVVIPAFNEECVIQENILLLDALLKSAFREYEIIVIDDCSMDNTLELLTQLSSSIKELKILHNDSNCGLGVTLRRGFLAANKELVFYTDADKPVDYREIYRAVGIIINTGSELVIGFSRNNKLKPPLRRLCTYFYNRLIRDLFGIKIRDINLSFKLFRRTILRNLNLQSSGSFIDAEIVIKSNYLGYKITQIGVEYLPRQGGVSHLFNFKNIACILFEIIKYYSGILKLKKRGYSYG